MNLYKNLNVNLKGRTYLEGPAAKVSITQGRYREVLEGMQLLLLIQGVSRLQGITAGGDFLGLCDQKSSYKHVSDFGRLRSYDRLLSPVHALV